MDTVNINKIESGKINNCSYLVSKGKSCNAIIIDPSWDIKKIEDSISKEKLTLNAIFLTHHHYDHTNLVNRLVNKYNCEVFMSAKESDFYNFRCDNLNKITDGQMLKIDDIEIECILTPGHTKGSMCYRINNNFFTGDTLFIRSCGVCTCKGSDPDQMYLSLKKIKLRLNKDTKIFPGHIFQSDERYWAEYIKRNIFLNINDKELFKKLLNTFNSKNFDKFDL